MSNAQIKSHTFVVVISSPESHDEILGLDVNLYLHVKLKVINYELMTLP